MSRPDSEDDYSEKFDSEEEEKLEKVIQKPNLKLEWREEDRLRPIQKEKPQKEALEPKLEYQEGSNKDKN